ncbi:MBL fold metallo-hydrolase [Oceanicella actignis]|uniref:Glyoxylase, beta-lactamase superfamily II n=1 Tax=Oceanicella actignis TaxID=1189325 RepID=A0A1M7S0Z4_9RHOB|nr:MBL fold metallo-hydrolase [Oceanicella actignis]SES92608.1 Glyoxylase, beta-lactamase superfamily II [Oceanicella actignis]SHN52173.1 Glyoxylase, beta-lactamase superfamily II [Oceanicella actignis]
MTDARRMLRPAAPSRRDLLRLAALAPALSLAAPLRALALGPAPADQAPGWFRFMLGETEITICSDGALKTPTTLLGVNAPREEVAAYLAAHHLDAQTNYAHTNHVVIRRGQRVALVDLGSGSRWQATAGRLPRNMQAAGLAPDEVTDVFVTHAHPDHIWGAMDDFDEPLMVNARHRIGADERAFWMQEGLIDRVEPQMQQFVVGARNAIEALGDQLTDIAPDEELAPGMRAVATPGHTAGHMSLLVEDPSGARLMALGDAMNHALISVERPDWHFGFDADREMAARTRRALLARAADEGLVVVGYHFPFPGVGHIIREGEGFRFLPALWRWPE